MDRGAWGATVHGVTKSQTLLSTSQLVGRQIEPIFHLTSHLQVLENAFKTE